jgi:AbrB family looped-hinge helix DNA binding protein
MIIKINSRNKISIPKSVCKQLNIKVGDVFLLDVQDNVIVLIPQIKSYTKHLQGLHSEIWKDIDVEEYITNERNAW